MVQSAAFDKRNIIVIGTLGIGKSTLMNTIYGEDQKFVAKNFSESVTKTISAAEFTKEGINYTVIDTPGLNDPNMDINTWCI